jgi:hydrogenase expression/formation protein HypE
MTATIAEGLVCPAPAATTERVQLGHGSGGKLSAALVRDRFLPHFDDAVLARLGDAAVVPIEGEELAITTDTFVVHPVEFPGGNIGSLAVHGTVNDLAMMGARPRYLTAGFVLEEGLPFDLLDRVVAAMAAAAREAGVGLVAADTKVVERGRGDGIYINTTGIGSLRAGFRPVPEAARPGDVVLVSGPIGRHGMAVMAVREGLGFESALESDSAALWPLVERLEQAVGRDVHVLRDPTRGGLASALNEIAAASQVGIDLLEAELPVTSLVAGACELLGLDPLYVACEGVLMAIVAPDAAAAALAALRSHPLGADAAKVGTVTADHPRFVALRTALGGRRVVDLLPGDQLPRIC